MEDDTDPPGSVEEQFYSVMGLLSEYLDMVSNAVLKDEGKIFNLRPKLFTDLI